MVTFRQIQELTAARMSGEVPSYPEQWPTMLKKVKMARTKKRLPRLASEPSLGTLTELEPDQEAAFGNVTKKLQWKNAPSRAYLPEPFRPLELPVRQLSWPLGREDQLQKVRNIRRMLEDLNSYLSFNSILLHEALPRRAVSVTGTVTIATLYDWLCSLKRELASAGSTTPSSRERSASPEGGKKKPSSTTSKSKTPAPEPIVVKEKGGISKRALREVVLFLDPEGIGYVSTAGFLESFRVAKRLSLGLDEDEKLQRAAIASVPRGGKQHDDRSKLREASTTGDSSEVAPMQPDEEDEDGSLGWYREEDESPSKRKDKKKMVEEPSEIYEDGCFLSSRLGPIFEPDVHDVVDVIFRKRRSSDGTGYIAAKCSLEETSARCRTLRRMWAVDHQNNTQPEETELERDRARLVLEDSDEEAETARAALSVAKVFTALEDHLAHNIGLRFVEFAKQHGLVQMPGSAFGSGVAIAECSARRLRQALCGLFKRGPNPADLAEGTSLVTHSRTRLAMQDEQQRHDALIERRVMRERKMKRAGVGFVFLRVQKMLRRRGVMLREAMELLEEEQDCEDDYDDEEEERLPRIAVESLVGLIEALGEPSPPPAYLEQRERQAARAALKERAHVESQRANLEFEARMRMAEQSGCFEVFKLLDRFFRRFQLKAEDLWTRGMVSKQTAIVQVSQYDYDSDNSLNPQEFQDLLRACEQNVSLEQAKCVVRYLDKDGDGKLQYTELQSAIHDYRRHMRRKKHRGDYAIKRAQPGCALFPSRHVLTLCQYLLLVRPLQPVKANESSDTAPSSLLSTPAATTVKNNIPEEEHEDRPSVNQGPGLHVGFMQQHAVGFMPKEQFIAVSDVQRVVNEASGTALSAFFREIREKFHVDAYTALRDLRVKQGGQILT